MRRIRLGVNIDNVATVRNARGESYPSPLRAALLAEKNGADSVTIHLREDRRHINEFDLKKIIKIVHIEIRKKMKLFINQNKNKKIVILDIPLLLENKINQKKDILIFVDSKKSQILKRLKKRKNFNNDLFKLFKKIQLPLDYKKNKSDFIIKNDFTKKNLKKSIKIILNKVLKWKK